MVQIGKDNPLYSFYKTGVKPAGQQPVQAQPAQVQKPQGGNDLQARLEAIDNAGALSPTVFNQATAGVQPQGGNNLMSRLDAIGTGELKPKTGREFDIMA